MTPESVEHDEHCEGTIPMSLIGGELRICYCNLRANLAAETLRRQQAETELASCVESLASMEAQRDAETARADRHLEVAARGMGLSNALRTERDGLRERLAAAEDQYYDLILQVENKHPGETRHETAKRYIQQVEHSGDRADAVQATSGEGA